MARGRAWLLQFFSHVYRWLDRLEKNFTPSGSGLLPARPPLRTVLESFPSYGSSPTKVSPRQEKPFSRKRPPLRELTLLGCGRLNCVPCGQQVRDASTDGRRSSFAFLV